MTRVGIATDRADLLLIDDVRFEQLTLLGVFLVRHPRRLKIVRGRPSIGSSQPHCLSSSPCTAYLVGTPPALGGTGDAGRRVFRRDVPLSAFVPAQHAKRATRIRGSQRSSTVAATNGTQTNKSQTMILLQGDSSVFRGS
jgi:hypothetical protein